MNELSLIKSAEFGGIQCNFYKRENTICMTANQLCQCLDYSDKANFKKVISRHPYLKNSEFSFMAPIDTWEGGQSVPPSKELVQETRLFTEDGIYEVAFLSYTDKAKEFRAWVRGILKALRAGKAKLVGMTEYQQMMAQTRADNARIRKAQSLIKIADEYNGTYRQVMHAYATKELTGEFLLPLPKLEAKTYSAGEIGDMLGITGQMVGVLTNRHGLKTDKYGALFNDKAKHSNKEVQSFRYYENIVPALRGILAGQTA